MKLLYFSMLQLCAITLFTLPAYSMLSKQPTPQKSTTEKFADFFNSSPRTTKLAVRSKIMRSDQDINKEINSIITKAGDNLTLSQCEALRALYTELASKKGIMPEARNTGMTFAKIYEEKALCLQQKKALEDVIKCSLEDKSNNDRFTIAIKSYDGLINLSTEEQEKISYRALQDEVKKELDLEIIRIKKEKQKEQIDDLTQKINNLASSTDLIKKIALANLVYARSTIYQEDLGTYKEQYEKDARRARLIAREVSGINPDVAKDNLEPNILS
jgi:hypothetical protein